MSRAGSGGKAEEPDERRRERIRERERFVRGLRTALPALLLVAWVLSSWHIARLPAGRWVVEHTPLGIIAAALVLIPTGLVSLVVVAVLGGRGVAVPWWVVLAARAAFSLPIPLAWVCLQHPFSAPDWFLFVLVLGALTPILLARLVWALAEEHQRHCQEDRARSRQERP